MFCFVFPCLGLPLHHFHIYLISPAARIKRGSFMSTNKSSITPLNPHHDFWKKVLSSDLIFLLSVFSGRFSIRSVTWWLWDRQPGKHALVPSYTSQYTACPRSLSTPWELLLWRAVHCGTGAIERDKEIMHKFRIDLQNGPNSLSWH